MDATIGTGTADPSGEAEFTFGMLLHINGKFTIRN
jgi:hypothetical protein